MFIISLDCVWSLLTPTLRLELSSLTSLNTNKGFSRKEKNVFILHLLTIQKTCSGWCYFSINRVEAWLQVRHMPFQRHRRKPVGDGQVELPCGPLMLSFSKHALGRCLDEAITHSAKNRHLHQGPEGVDAIFPSRAKLLKNVYIRVFPPDTGRSCIQDQTSRYKEGRLLQESKKLSQ